MCCELDGQTGKTQLEPDPFGFLGRLGGDVFNYPPPHRDGAFSDELPPLLAIINREPITKHDSLLGLFYKRLQG